MKLLLVLPISLLFAGCRSSTNDARVSSTPPQQKPLKIALITPAQTNDPVSEHAHRSAFESGDTIENLQASGTDQVSVLRNLAAQKPDLLFCPSAECGDGVAAVAAKFPRTRFVVLGETAKAANVATLAPRLDEAAYLCGIAAGDVSQSGTIGLVGSANSKRHQATFAAFAAGARSVNPKIQVKTIFVKTITINDFVNAKQAKTAAQSLMTGGADVLFHDIGDAGAGVLEAAQNAARAGKTVWAFGSGRNQNRLASDVTLGSATIEMGEVFDQFKESVRAGTFKAGVTELKISEETVAVEWNEENRERISRAAWDKIDGAMEQLKLGKLKLGVSSFPR